MFSLNRSTVRKPRNHLRPCRCLRYLVLIILVTNFSRAVTAINQESLNAISDQAKTLRSEWREASLRSAIAKYREGEAQAQTTGNYDAAAEMAMNAGDVYFLLGEYK